MKNMTFTTVLLCMLFMPFFISSCTDKIDEHYEEPEWLKGSAWEVLEDRGNYSLFLQAVSVIDVTARSVKIIAIFLFIVIFLSKSNFAVLHFSAAR